jgi:hypothetical protein
MIDRFSRVIVDTDVCIKLFEYKALDAMRLVFDGIADEVCIHRYLVEEELVSGPIRVHVRELMADGILNMLDPNTVLSQMESVLYHATAMKFAQVHGVDLSKSRCEHMGEVLTVALAKTLGIGILLSDESVLQYEINRVLNTGLDDLRVLRMWDIIHWIMSHPDCGIKRRDAKTIWLASGYHYEMRKRKERFDEAWPTN